LLFVCLFAIFFLFSFLFLFVVDIHFK